MRKFETSKFYVPPSHFECQNYALKKFMFNFWEILIKWHTIIPNRPITPLSPDLDTNVYILYLQIELITK